MLFVYKHFVGCTVVGVSVCGKYNMSAFVFRCLRNVSKSSASFRAALTVLLRGPDVTAKCVSYRLHHKYGNIWNIRS